ncbi:hypothetical protein N799_04395 [Lysobacter arseniciresistens ZS79]|uniref:Thioredoxin domain-containing protein n=1 Tax=Lysobacter arseniciresistens ZS79 TaxID=913325 RepID=A0A0A0F1P4_9GAMM|nr:TlpA disulfide reductase family protein [Lysobacter arseniciresistens]KGM56470.1 hypothetical protein N799_04395 [Lysobacter arseniciresistens ZS79]
MTSTGKVLLVALGAGLLGAVAGVLMNGPGPLLRSELGQQALQQAMTATAPPTPDGLAVAVRGEPIPPLTLPDLQGEPATLPADYAGRPLLVNFWASWCGPCIEEMPELDRFAATQGANGVQVVGIALDEPDAVRAFLQHTPVDYPILLDVAGPADTGVQLGNARGVLPYTVLVDAQGRLVKQKIGPFEHGEVDGWVGH